MNTAITAWACGSLSVIPFASFAWAIKKHFVCPGPMPMAMRALSVFSTLAYVSFLFLLAWHGSVDALPAIMAGQLLFCLATMVFWWAIGTTSTAGLRIAYQGENAPDVVSTGPFALVRHPFYLAYMLFWTGTALIAGGWQWLPLLVLVTWYTSIARAEERRMTLSKSLKHYDAYRHRTGMFFPAVWK